MARKPQARRIARITPHVAGSLIAVALAVPSAASAAFPTDGGRILMTDGDGTASSVWADGTHSRAETTFPSMSKVDGWHAGGVNLIFTDGGSAAYAPVDDGQPFNTSAPGFFKNSPGNRPIAGAALGPDGVRAALATDEGVFIVDGGGPETIYEAPAGRVAWSAQSNEGTLVWDGFAVQSDPGIPGGDLPLGSMPNDGSGGGIWMRLGGAAPVEVVTDSTATDPSISQDGKLIAWAQDGPTGGTDIYYLDPTEVNPVVHLLAGSTSGNDNMPAVSPDGTQIAFVSGDQPNQTLKIANLDGSPGTNAKALTNGVTGVAWQPVTKADAGAVSVSGTAAVGETLTATGGASSGTAPVTDSYEWQRCDVDIAPEADSCSTVGTGTTYTVAEADRGYALRVVKKTTNPAGSDSVTSDRTATVPGADPTPTDPTPTPTDPTPTTPADTTAPLKPTLSATPASEDDDTTPTFEWHPAEAGGTFECRVLVGLSETGNGWVGCDSPFTASAELADGYHTFAVRQIDDAGNIGSTRYYEWKVDTERPEALSLTAHPAAQTSDTSATFEFSGVEQHGTVQCRLDPLPEDQDASSWHTCGSPQIFHHLAAGTHTFEVRELDAAGNRGAVTTWTWTIADDSSTPPVPHTPEPPAEPEPKPETPAQPEPEPETPVVEPPVVETPAIETPSVETPRPAAPAPRLVTPEPPALVATIGGTKSGGQAGGGTSSAATIEVAKESVGVGCSITGTLLKSCRVDLYATVDSGTTARSAKSEQVLVGTGTYEKAAGSSEMDVKVELNATGKALLRKSPGGLKVSVKITGTPVTGAPLKASGVAKLVTDRASLTVGGFAVDSAVLTPAAKAQLRALAKFGKVATVRCAGHTDGSSDDGRYLRSLGAKRAKAVCAYLAAHGVKGAKPTLVSKADTAPIATNTTKAGRAKNRRVQVALVR